jgi:hypothetical protein
MVVFPGCMLSIQRSAPLALSLPKGIVGMGRSFYQKAWVTAGSTGLTRALRQS